MAKITLEFDDETLVPDKFFWASLIRHRAGYRCEDCGGENNIARGLEAHHIDGNKKNNRLMNGVALCNACHNDRHMAEQRARIAVLNANGQAKRGAEAARQMWLNMSADERAAAIARIRATAPHSCEPGCTCKRHSKPRLATCKRGHPYDEANTYVYVRNGRECRGCRACRRIAEAKQRKKRRAKGVIGA